MLAYKHLDLDFPSSSYSILTVPIVTNDIRMLLQYLICLKIKNNFDIALSSKL